MSTEDAQATVGRFMQATTPAACYLGEYRGPQGFFELFGKMNEDLELTPDPTLITSRWPRLAVAPVIPCKRHATWVMPSDGRLSKLTRVVAQCWTFVCRNLDVLEWRVVRQGRQGWFVGDPVWR
jgi:hypothetical protein